MFMFVIFILYACLALWIFANNMEDSVMDSFVTEKISQYSLLDGSLLEDPGLVSPHLPPPPAFSPDNET